MLGQRVNNFEIVRLIGEGGMGAVYEAEHPMIHRKVAIKVLRRELAVDDAVVRRFVNEARATNEVRHPNIIQIIDAGTLESGLPYLIMEMLEGETLAQRLDTMGPLPIATAVDLTLQAASALQATHSVGIVHRDLKPDNLFLIPDTRVAGHELIKVLDFGIAKLRDDRSPTSVNTHAGAVLGTPPYMSPEQCRGLPEGVDHRSDVYALAIILYEMLCGEPPFVGPGFGDVMLMHMSQPPEPPSIRRRELGKELERIILRALAKRPEDRIPSMAEFWRDLVQAVPGGPASLEPPSAKHFTSRVRPSRMDATLLSAEAPDTLVLPPTPTDHVEEAKAQRAAAPATRPRSARTWRVLAPVALLAFLGALAALASDRAAPRSPKVSLSVAAAALGQPRVPLVPSAIPTVREREVDSSAPEDTAARVAPLIAANGRATPGRAAVLAARPKPALQPASVTASVAAPVPSITPSAEPPKAAAEPGYLSLDSAPWSNVFLGSRLLGSTPLIRIPLPAGKHVLMLKNPELSESTSYVVEIKPGASVSRFVGWGKE